MSNTRYLLETSLPLLWLLIATIGASVHSARSTKLTRLEIWQRWWAIAALSCGSLWMTLSFLAIPDIMATAIGFSDTPFVTEIAFANLALAIGGFRAIHAGPRERITIGLMAGMFLWGAILGHVFQSLAHGNWEPGNTGGVLLYDALIPAVMIALAVRDSRKRGASRREAQRVLG
ncbi:hypothetical protein D9V32_11155 [Mycetocola tolaasinivorans]|uniref:Uncharacterized protein n=1 Tax=Mycetocola tolaasinivorans TaxID=76635 RepID=A0A3L7A541_9MICO|nr:DUF6790 family protein [Mycetocola tolaasinivorans]RLP74980.1 hypothetical protein D9V32_11155 [Mycetocola tolaasinivorans]